MLSIFLTCDVFPGAFRIYRKVLHPAPRSISLQLVLLTLVKKNHCRSSLGSTQTSRLLATFDNDCYRKGWRLNKGAIYTSYRHCKIVYLKYEHIITLYHIFTKKRKHTPQDVSLSFSDQGLEFGGPTDLPQSRDGHEVR